MNTPDPTTVLPPEHRAFFLIRYLDPQHEKLFLAVRRGEHFYGLPTARILPDAGPQRCHLQDAIAEADTSCNIADFSDELDCASFTLVHTFDDLWAKQPCHFYIFAVENITAIRRRSRGMFVPIMGTQNIIGTPDISLQQMAKILNSPQASVLKTALTAVAA